MIYLTLGDQYSGVVSSQVIDVCKHLIDAHDHPVRLVSFISLRGFRAQRKKFKAEFPSAMVLPMWPRLVNWEKNYFLLRIILFGLKDRKIMTRGILACNLALKLKEKGRIDWVCLDARGAYEAEWHEYEVVDNETMKQEVKIWEEKAVNESDFRLGVSQKLVEYWRNNFGYQSDNHVVIPCTINQYFERNLLTEGVREKIRTSYGYQKNDIVLVYAGSSAGWQSFQMLDRFLISAMEKQPFVHVLFLAKIDLTQLQAYAQFPDRIRKDWVSHQEIFQTLAMCDYGILIRENTVTNQVAAPTKFGEYLSAGLKILITPELGDYSDFAEKYECGWIIEPENRFDRKFTVVSMTEREKSRQLAMEHFTKEAHKPNYQRLIHASI
ncbi:MAG: hypothetical protein KDD99_13255 [Bacteroidetes bacterium]|nr:hypothetical protein [Bacteroidota bacterium]